MSHPWMPLYIADYLADTGHLTGAEHGAYMLLIMRYWQDGGLPADERLLARFAKMTADQWSESRDILAALFEDGWRHKRIDEELTKATEIVGKRKAAAERSHASRGAKPKQEPGTCSASAEQVQVQQASICSDTRVPPSPSPSKEGSEAIASGAVAPIAEPVYVDDKHELWAEGVLLLGQLGLNEAKARQMIGRWCRDTANDYAGVMTAIQQARDQRPAGDVVAWITRALPTKANHERNRPTRPPSAHDNIFAAVGELLDGLPDGGRREASATGAFDTERDREGVYRLSG